LSYSRNKGEKEAGSVEKRYGTCIGKKSFFAPKRKNRKEVRTFTKPAIPRRKKKIPSFRTGKLVHPSRGKKRKDDYREMPWTQQRFGEKAFRQQGRRTLPSWKKKVFPRETINANRGPLGKEKKTLSREKKRQQFPAKGMKKLTR